MSPMQSHSMSHHTDHFTPDPLDDGLQDLGLPVPVQTFLWTQIFPFIRPKLGKSHEACCMFCQHAPGHHELKEACKSFEKVVVQGIHYGLSIPLTSSLQSIPRWRLVQASLPHIMQCAAALLHNRVKDFHNLGAAETKLLYTLHWIFLSASEECIDEETELQKSKQKNGKRKQPYLFSIPTISLFMYLFGPIIHILKESDFQNYRLENGIRLWQPMWEYKAPGALCFTAPVKPKARQLLSPLSPRGSSEVFSARKHSESTPRSADSSSYSDIKNDEEGSWVSSPKDLVFPETIPEEASSVEEERVVIFRLPASSHMMDSSYYTADASLLQQQHHQQEYLQEQQRRNSKQLIATKEKLEKAFSRFDFDKLPIESITKSVMGDPPAKQHTIKAITDDHHYQQQQDGSKLKKLSSSTEKDDSIDSRCKSPLAVKYDIAAATFMDVAVLRCLFIANWQEDGIDWSLRYLDKRLREISDEASIPMPQPRRRSNSLPIPQIEISVYQGPGSRDSPSGNSTTTKDFIDLPDAPMNSLLNDSSLRELENTSIGQSQPPVRRASEKKRRVKMADLRAIIETRMFSKSDRALERIGIDPTPPQDTRLEHVDYHRSLDTGEEQLPGSGSIVMTTNLVKGKSMPSLRYVDTQHGIRESQVSGPHTTFYTRNPIITVTEHTPTPSPDFMHRQSSFDSQMDGFSNTGSGCGGGGVGGGGISIAVHPMGACYGTIINSSSAYSGIIGGHGVGIAAAVTGGFTGTGSSGGQAGHNGGAGGGGGSGGSGSGVGFRSQMLRSHTDSHIDYSGADESEVPGSSFYITRDGGIDYEVVLLAVYTVFKRESNICSLRVIETGLNICELLLDLGIMKMGEHSHHLAMGIVKRSLLHLGCSHCNSDVHRMRTPETEFLRTHTQTILARLLRQAPAPSRNYLRKMVRLTKLHELVEFFHAFLGFCVDPTSLLSPLNHKRTTTAFKNLTSDNGGGALSSGGQGGYATNFGSGLSGSAESQVIQAVFKPLVSRFVESFKELKLAENQSLYSDVRQLVNYVKGAHGGPFRRVILSGLLAVTPRPHKKPIPLQTTRVIRHIHHSDIPQYTQSDDARSQRKLFFKKRSTSSACASLLETDGLEEQCRVSQSPIGNLRRRGGTIRPTLTPRHSERALLSDSTSSSGNSISRISGIVRWFRIGKSKDHSSVDLEAGANIPATATTTTTTATTTPEFTASAFIRQGSFKLNGRRTGENLGRSILRARRRVERRLGRFGIGKGKKKIGGPEEITGSYFSRRSSFDYGEGIRESEVVVLKERRLVPTHLVQEGMARFSFLMEVCSPGTIPDAQMIGAILDLPQAPVVARAALLLECAHFVHLCNRGQWATWLKHNLPVYRPSGANINVRPPLSTGLRRTHILQRAAGKLFFQWAEVIGVRLEDMILMEKQSFEQIQQSIHDPEKQKELLQQDEEEDFLDEAAVNPHGNDCPPALKLIACMLLYEITAFLRETYQTLPKASKLSGKEKHLASGGVGGGGGGSINVGGTGGGLGNIGAGTGGGGVGHGGVGSGSGGGITTSGSVGDKPDARRWSAAVVSIGHSQTSAQSLQSIAGVVDSGPNDRKISFYVSSPAAPDNVSDNTSNTTVTAQGGGGCDESINPNLQQRRPVTNVRTHLLRRGTTAAPTGGSFKRRSLKLRRGTKDGKEIEVDLRRTDSVQSKRKVSSLSDRSDTSEQGIISGGEESPGILSDDQPPESPTDSNETDDTGKHLPWTRAVVQIMNSFYFYCNHQNYCHPYCYRRHMRASSKLVRAIRKVYGEEFGLVTNVDDTILSGNRTGGRRDRFRNRKVSDQSSTMQTSPQKRKQSLAKRDRIINDDLDSANISLQKQQQQLAQSKRNSSELSNKQPVPLLKYVKNFARELFHLPMVTLIKGAAVLNEELFIESIPIVWELLLEADQETVSSSAALFIISSVRAPNCASDIMQRALKSKDPNVRIDGILRFQVLWKNRFQVWPRMEEGAHMTFKVPPPGIEFTLPSPKIGIENLPVVDPSWIPRQQTKDVEVTLKQERHRTLVTATKTRKKQQTEAIQQAIQQQEDKQREERQQFLLTTIPITQQASHEPGLDHVPGEDHTTEEEEGGGDGGRTAPHLHAAHSLFPSVLCSSVMQIVACLDDAAVNSDGLAVYEVAYQVIWQCLVEDSALFLRYVLERLTRDRQDQMFKLLRHLIRFVPRLPQQAAFALYNYIIGYVMFYVRSSHECSQQLVGAALSVLWMVVHSVHGIMFKDLKQILRKEQCDASILLTANVPSAKRVIVFGPDEKGLPPAQFTVQEDTQFCQLLRESLDYFTIEEKFHNQYYLVDSKTHKMLNPNWYVRDLYFFKRSAYPTLRLIDMKADEAFNALQKQELIRKFVEIGKVHLTWAILKNVDMVIQRVVFLHEELMKLPSFPRKALEADLDLYHGGELGKELLGLDVLHKFMWVRLTARMFESMSGNFAYSADIQLFLNVLSGAAILHSEDACIMRYVMATFINAAFNFKNIFSTNGYFMIMPTLLQVYSLHQTNKLVTTTIEYAVKQFYLMNRKPFILQMFGSVSAILDTDEEGAYGEVHKVQSSCLFNLLLSLETPSPDPLNIAELLKEKTPLKAIDFCYHDEDEMVTVLDCITLCVMVVSYSAERTRGYQMLIILEAILPCYMQQIQSPTYLQCEGKTEREIILQLAVAVRTMVHNCEGLSKCYNGPYRNSPEHKGSSQRNCSRGGGAGAGGPPCSPGLDYEDESHSKYVSDMSRAKILTEAAEDSETVRAEYRRPRDVLLSVVGEFMSRAATRLTELAKRQSNDSKFVELLDVKCHVRLADIAHSLLKVSPYDPESMACRGLQRYMQCVLPRADWDNDGLRAALVTILRRLDKVFLKISKKPSIRRNTDWEAAAGLLKGIHETIVRHQYILHWQQVKVLLSTIQNLIVNEPGSQQQEGVSSAGAALMSQTPPAFFCSTGVRLLALQVVSVVECFTLEHICGGSAEFASQEKAEGFLLHLLMPLCIKACSGRGINEIGELKQNDITFLVSATLNSMSPPAGRTGQTGAPLNRTTVGDLRAGSLTFTGSRDTKRSTRISTSLYQAAFLSLRIISICFEPRMAGEWPRIVRVMRDLGRRNEAAPELWSFMEFVVTQRTPLYIVMMPFILQKISTPPINDHERHMQFLIRERMRGMPSQNTIKSRGALLLDLARELRDLKDELEEKRYEKEAPEPAKREISQINLPADTTKHQQQQRPSLISIFTTGVGGGSSQQIPSHISSSLQFDSRSGTGGICTPSDSLSQNTLHPPRDTSSGGGGSITTTTTTNKDQNCSLNGTTPTPSMHALTIQGNGVGEGNCSGAMSQFGGGGGSATTLPGTGVRDINGGMAVTKGSGSCINNNNNNPMAQLSHSISLQQQYSWKTQPRLRFVQSVEYRHSSGETSTTPLSPESPLDDNSSGETSTGQGPQTQEEQQQQHQQQQQQLQQLPSRLQRSKAQSRKTFRLRRGRQSHHGESLSQSMDIPETPKPTAITSTDISWDSVSQTSSTSGYRDNYSIQTGLLSPDGSLAGAGIRSLSQHSLLMLFETQDEDTLI